MIEQQPPQTTKKWAFSLFLLLLIGCVFTALGFIGRAGLSAYQPRNPAKYIIEVELGSSPIKVSQKLESMGVIRSASLFYWVGKVRGKWGNLKRGEYEVSPSMSSGKLLEILISGKSVSRPFLVREGENIYEIAAEIFEKGFGNAQKFISLARSPKFIKSLNFPDPHPKSLEGYLFPDTYQLERKMTQEDIIKLMAKRFMSVWGPNEDQRAKELQMTRDEVVTLASIVEKETGAPGERAMIAGVFHNRLKKGMKLQSDPTSIYGIWERYDGNLRKSDLMDQNPYNTYFVKRLPVGPIGNPGLEAIKAVLYPAEHNYFYFVSKNDGTHTFTARYEDHAKAVRDYQINKKAREGKSWRDLKKNPSSTEASATPKT